jgi:hypothetical protein
VSDEDLINAIKYGWKAEKRNTKPSRINMNPQERINVDLLEVDGNADFCGGQKPVVIMLAKNVGPITTLICAHNRGGVQRKGENFDVISPNAGYF